MNERKQSEEQGSATSVAAPFFWYERVLNVIDRVSSVGVMTAMAMMTAVISSQVFFRYVLNSSLDWGEELPRICFVFVVLLAIPLGIKRGSHVGIDILANFLSVRWNQIIYRFNLLLIIALMCLAGYYAVFMAQSIWDQLFYTLPVSTGVLYVGVIISTTHSVMHLLRLIWAGPPITSSFADK